MKTAEKKDPTKKKGKERPRKKLAWTAPQIRTEEITQTGGGDVGPGDEGLQLGS